MSSTEHTSSTGYFFRCSQLGGLLSVVLLALVWNAPFTAADSKQTLSWDSLLPPEHEQLMDAAAQLRSRFVQLPKTDQRYYLAVTQALDVKARIDTGLASIESIEDWERELLESGIIEQHPGVEALWKDQSELDTKMQAAGNLVAEQLDGKLVEIPGFVLPVDATADPIKEFIFVADLSVFVHPPAPPANQVIHVTFTQGLSQQQLSEPIWLEGILSTTGGRHTVAYDDEDRVIDAAYTLIARNFRAYEP